MFGFGKKLFKSGQKVANKNIMEAIVAGCLLVAAADGDIEKSELQKLEGLIANNDALSAFRKTDIQAVIRKYAALLEEDFMVGRRKMLKELEDIADNADHAEEVFVNMLAIAKADGEIEPAELKVLTDVAGRLGVDTSDFGLAA